MRDAHNLESGSGLGWEGEVTFYSGTNWPTLPRPSDEGQYQQW